MKSVSNKIKVIVLILFLLIENGCAQEMNKIKGTIGNEKMGKDKIVICVLGTKACMPVKIDTSMTVKYQNKDTKLTDLPFGLYLEADIIDDKPNGKTVKSISIDETKTSSTILSTFSSITFLVQFKIKKKGSDKK